MGQLANKARRLFDDADTVKSAEWDEWRACADDLIRKLEAIEKGGALADRISDVQGQLHQLPDVAQPLLDEMAAVAARAAIIELDNESLAAINARVEQENDLMDAVVEAARDYPNLRTDAAVAALDAWRKSQEASNG